MTPPDPAPSRIVVALDGPASSGKSSVGAAVAERLGLRFLDTGLIYRALTALALGAAVAPDDQPGLIALIPRFELRDDGTGRLTRVLLDGNDATHDVRSHEVDASVSAVARQPDVRAALLEYQHRLAQPGGILMAGRDIGTVVLPNADLKVYLDASVEERAMRRIRERGLDPAGEEAEEVREHLRSRDAVDRGRAVAPLRVAEDAVVVSTDGMDFDEVVDLVARLVTAAENAMTKSEVPEGRPADSPAPRADGGDPKPQADGGDEKPRADALEPKAAATASTGGASRPKASASTAANRPEKRSHVLEVAMRLDNDQTMLVRMVARLSQWAAHLFAKIEIEGLEHVPRKGALILALNHASNADAIVGGAWVSDALRTRRIHWLGKRELFDWPVFGWVCAHGGVHPVDRSTADVEAYRLATKILERGYVLLIFPEGTRSPTGALQEAKDGMAQLAMRTGAQILPIGINGSDRVWPKGQKLPHPFPRRKIVVRIGKPFLASDVVPPIADRRAAKTATTTAIMGRIAELLDPRQRGVYASAVREREPEKPRETAGATPG
ncbi:MAG TPA: (d)CMP kinase [Candidatus Limnocylindrales bacterium]